MSRDFDSMKNSHSTELKRRLQIFVRGSKLSGLHPSDNMAINH